MGISKKTLINQLEVENTPDPGNLKTGHELFDSLLSTALLDKQLQFTQVNAAFASAIGKTPDDFQGQSLFDMFPGSESEETVRYAIESNNPVTLYSRTVVIHNQSRPGLRYLDINLYPVRDNDRVTGIAATIIDATDRVQAQDELHQVQAQFEHIFESAPDANVLVDEAGTILIINRCTETLFGYQRNELIGQSIEMLLPERLRTRHARFRKAYKRKAHVRPMGQDLNLSGLRKNGEEIPVDITLSPLHTEKGLLVLAVIRDLSTRKLAEQALREQSAYVKILSDVAVAANEAESVEAALKYTLDRLCGHSNWLIGHALIRRPDGLLVSAQVWHFDDPALASGFKAASETTQWVEGEGLPGLVLTHGKVAWFSGLDGIKTLKRRTQALELGIKSGFAFPIWSGRDVVGVMEFYSTSPEKPLTSLLDIMPGIGTQLGRVIERKRIERERQSQERMLRTVLNSLPVGVWVADAAGRLITVNTAGARIWGRPQETQTGQPTGIEAWWTEIRRRTPTVDQALHRALEDGTTSQNELVQITSLDRIQKSIINSVISLIGPDGTTTGAIVVQQDVTEKQMMEAELDEVQKRLMESVESERLHLARELHDGPIQDLYSTTFQIQEAGELPQAESAVVLGEIRTTIQQVISMLRVICGDLRPPALAPFGLETAIRSHAAHFRENPPDIKVHLDLDADQQSLPEVTRLALFRIYQQLLNNIVKHARASEVWVVFKLLEGEIKLEVRDDGVGFKPSRRWIELARDGHLGLVGASERAESLGGSLTIESAPGQGTRITASIPHKELSPV